MRLVAPLFVCMVLILQAKESSCVCCNPDTGWLLGSGLHSLYARCLDSTRPTPCCGYGRCNIFCCNCDGGCRKRDRRKREDAEEVIEKDPFVDNDGDGDGRISLNEARGWVMSGQCGNPLTTVLQLGEQFEGLDNDRDGYLDRNEIGG